MMHMLQAVDQQGMTIYSHHTCNWKGGEFSRHMILLRSFRRRGAVAVLVRMGGLMAGMCGEVMRLGANVPTAGLIDLQAGGTMRRHLKGT